MLTIVGLGLRDEKDLTLRGIEAAKAADTLYIETYTSVWHGLKELERIVGKPIKELKRGDLEDNAKKIVDEAKEKDVVLFVPGDPLVATTHLILIEMAKETGLKTKIIHNTSIISAVAETGLHIYKFGATATVPFPEKTKGALPESVYDVIRLNKTNGLHTLLLLDITPEKCMLPKEAIELLLKIEEKRKEGVFTAGTPILIFARAGSEDSRIAYGEAKELAKKDFGKPPMVIIVPGKMHFTENGYLEKLKYKN
jgi:diphthine synthase